MSQRIEDYALIGDLHTAALVGLDGSVDWLCLPHFDSPSCFSRLLGEEEHGFWRLAPDGGATEIVATRRWYRPDTLVLETEFDTPTGTVRITDCMPVRDEHPHLVRTVEGVYPSATSPEPIGRFFRNIAAIRTHPILQLDRNMMIAARTKLSI